MEQVKQTTVSLELPEAHWDVVIKGLGELPAKMSMPIIQSLQIQAQTKLNDGIRHGNNDGSGGQDAGTGED